MSDNNLSSNNKRIAKNTMILYIRMLLMMVISLYTSRIILDALGAVDYGLYNVVGGFVVALGFLSGTLNTASSRFITVALSKGDCDEMRRTFTNVLFVNCLLAFIVIILGETIGLWFLYNKMQIPEDRFFAAQVVYQMSIFTVAVNIISTAYNACIIAHEKMKAFAYITLIDAIGKLLIAYLLLHVSSLDKLILYGGLLLVIQLLDRIIYGIYCKKNFSETKILLSLDKTILSQMFKFISWASYGSFVSIGFTQGLNILLNLFFGPAVNAARAISVQVQNAVNMFTTNFQTAINPQLTKSVATKDFEVSRSLLIASSKYSFYLLCLIGIPLIIVTPVILSLWLKEVPEHTVWFVRLMLIISIWSSIANPLRIINQAEGNIKKFQLYECTVLLMIVPISYVILKFYAIPEYIFIIHLVIELIASFIRIKIVLPKVKMKLYEYLNSIYIPLCIIFITSLLFGIILLSILGYGLWQTIAELIMVELFMLFIIYKYGMTKNERKKSINIIKVKLINTIVR